MKHMILDLSFEKRQRKHRIVHRDTYRCANRSCDIGTYFYRCLRCVVCGSPVVPQ